MDCNEARRCPRSGHPLLAPQPQFHELRSWTATRLVAARGAGTRSSHRNLSFIVPPIGTLASVGGQLAAAPQYCWTTLIRALSSTGFLRMARAGRAPARSAKA